MTNIAGDACCIQLPSVPRAYFCLYTQGSLQAGSTQDHMGADIMEQMGLVQVLWFSWLSLQTRTKVQNM